MATESDKLNLVDKRQHMLVNPHTSGNAKRVEEWMLASAVTGEIVLQLDDENSEATINTLNFGGTEVIQFIDKDQTLSMIKNNAADLKLAEGADHLTLVSGKTAEGITEYTLGETDIASKSALDQEVTDRTNADAALKSELQANIDTVAGSVEKISDDVYKSPNGLFPRVGVLEGALDAERKLRDEQKENIDKEFKNVVYWDLPKKEDGRNTVTLNNDDQLISKTTNGDGVPLIYMTKWDGIQVGGSKNKYFTVAIDTTNEAVKVSGATRMTVNDKNYVAYLSDIDAVTTDVNAKLKTVSDNLTQEITDRKAGDDSIEAAVGLTDDGKHRKTSGTYTSGATTVVGEIEALDKVVSGITITEMTSEQAGAGYRKGYKLLVNGVQHGDTIKIPDDSALVEAYIGRTDDKFVGSEASGNTITGSTTAQVVSGSTGNVSLNLIYKVTDGTFTMVKIDFAALTLEKQFLDGLEMVDLDNERPGDDYGVKVKIADDSEKFLTVSMAGVKLSGVQAAIDAAQASATTTVEHATGNTHVTVSESTDEEDGHTIYTVNETNIANASDLTQEIADRKKADEDLKSDIEDAIDDAVEDLEGKITAEKTRAEGKEGELKTAIEAEVTRATTEEGKLDTAIKAEATTREEEDGKLSTAIGAEKTRAEGVEKELSDKIDALSGSTKSLQDELDETQKGAGLGTDGKYTAPTGTSYVSGATSLADADKKLDEALKNVESTAIFGVASGSSYDDCNIKVVDGPNGHKLLDFTHMIIDCGTF